MAYIKNFFSKNSVAVDSPCYNQIAKGSDKKVYVCANSEQNYSHAFYTPNRAFLFSRKKALLSEKNKIDAISVICENKNIDKRHLAINWKQRRKEKEINKQITMKVDFSKSNLERKMNDRTVLLPQRISFMRDAIKGLYSLHQTGHVHKDLKLENLLVFDDAENEGNELVKLSDFGRSLAVAAKENIVYDGNTRFVAPDGGLTQKSEVFSLALILIRGFEGVLKDPVMEVPKGERDCKAHDSRVGLDKFVLEHKAFICCENKGTSFGRIKNCFRRNRMNKDSPEKKAERCRNQEKILAEYIDKMVENLRDPSKIIEGQTLMDSSQADSLSSLLKSMIQEKPDERPSMEDVLNKYNEIFPA